MKRIAVLFVGVLLIMCQLAACNAEHIPDETEPFEIITDKTETEYEGNDTIMPSPEQTVAEQIMLVKYFSQQSEWDDEILLAVSEYTAVVLREDSTQKHSTLSDTLEQTKNMTVRSMEDEFDNLLATAMDELDLVGVDSFVTKESTLDVQIRHADSVAVSLLSDSTLVFGKINNSVNAGAMERDVPSPHNFQRRDL